MNAVPCTGLLDEARVTVDTALLERAASQAPVLAIALVLSLVGLGLAVRAAPRGHGGWSFFTLLAPMVAAFVSFFFELRTELHFACVDAPATNGLKLIAVSAGIATLAFVQLGITLTLRSWKREVQVVWPVMLLTSALLLAGGVGAHKLSLQREFERRVDAVMPVPNVMPNEKPPEAHVGLTLTWKPEVQQAGRVTGFIFTNRVAMSDDERKGWRVDSVELTAAQEGPTVVPLHLEQDLVSVDVELSVVGVRDEGPPWFPLEKGNRWEFIAVRGRGGALDKVRAQVVRGKKPLLEPSFVLEVTAEGQRDGFHFFEVTETRQGAEPRTRKVVRRDGQLFSNGSRVGWSEQGYCQLKLVEPSQCTCVEDRVTECRVVSGDLGETVLRLFLGAVTLGLTELQGMGDLGKGQEAGVLLTRWTIEGREHALAPILSKGSDRNTGNLLRRTRPKDP